MITKAQLNQLKQQSSHQALLSLYLDIHPGKAETQENAPLIRAKDALKELVLPKPFIQEVTKLITTELIRRQARTLVLFTNENLSYYKRFALQLELPELNEKGVLASWGKALTTPLKRLTNNRYRYALVYIDQARWRYFEIFLDDIKELQDAFRPLSTHNWRNLSESHVGVAQEVMARGGIAKDKVQQREQVWTERFYKDVTSLLGNALKASHTQNLILMGTARHVNKFQTTLDPKLQESIIDCVSPPANPNADANELLKLVKPCITKHEKCREMKLIKGAIDKGILGLTDTLEALQKGQLATVIAPWGNNPGVYLSHTTGYVTTCLEDAEKQDPKPCLEPLHNVLDELTDRYGTELRYVRKEAETALNDAGGLAGLRRW